MGRNSARLPSIAIRWSRPVGLTVLLAFGVGLIVGLGYFLFVRPFLHPVSVLGVDVASAEAEIAPGEVVLAHIEVSLNMNEVFDSFDNLRLELSLVDPSDRAAVYGSFELDSRDETQPALVTDHVDAAAVDLIEFPCDSTDPDCRIPVIVQLGNVGSEIEHWNFAAKITRTVNDEAEAQAFQVPSLDVVLSDTQSARNLWPTLGPISMTSPGDLVAYSATFKTSVSDPTLFDVVVTEPRRFLVTRSLHAVIGPADLSESLVYLEPSDDPLSVQSHCDNDGCILNVVALFNSREGDWWVPIMLPSEEAAPDLFVEHTAEIDIEPAQIAEASGSLGVRDSKGSLTIRFEGDSTTSEAAVSILVYPEDEFEWAVPNLRTDDGQELLPYRWFDLECDDNACVGEVTANWDLQRQDGPAELRYWVVGIGGVGGGLASPRPLTMRLTGVIE